MNYASLVGRLGGAGAAAWDIHYAAIAADRNGQDIIFASIGDPDFGTPEPIVVRAVTALENGDTHYSDVPGRPALRAAIAAHVEARLGFPCAAENVVVVAGAQNGLFAASLCLFEPGHEIILLEPAYVTYEATFGLSGATLVRVGMSGEAGFRLDPQALEAAVTPHTRGIVLANPNNPTGVVMTRSELDAVARIALAYDLWVVVDEVYASLTFERPHVSLASLPGMADRTATIGSLSKSHAMTGWRVGWVVGPPALAAHIERLALTMVYGLPGFIQEAAITALEHYDQTTGDMRAAYRHRRDLVVTALSETPGLRVLVPEAGMFVLLDTRGTGLPPLDLAWRLLREEGVSLLDASAFGAAASGFLRMSFTMSDVELQDASQRIDRFFRSLTDPATLRG